MGEKNIEFFRAAVTCAVRNGQAAPLEAVPELDMDSFASTVLSMLREGARLLSLFALPAGENAGGPETGRDGGLKTGGDDGGVTPDGEFLLLAALAGDMGGQVHFTSTRVRGAYPSLTPLTAQAHLFERDIFERHGLVPEGHPWLKPVRFPHPAVPVGVMDFFRIAGDEVHEVAVGPVHAGIIECGHFRFQCLGETVMHLEISLGYHHRGLEELVRGGPDARSSQLMEVLSGDASVAHTWAWCTLLEALSGRPSSPRGQIIRALALELERLANHTGDMGALAGDVGFLPTQAWCGRLRGDWLNMTALLCGNRFGRGLLRPGGTAFDLDRELLKILKERLAATARDVEGALKVLWDSPSVLARFTGVGRVSARDAVDLGLVGVAARACGLERDARLHHPLDGAPASPEAQTAPWGDVHARARVRHGEIRASVAFCRRLLDEFLDVDDGPAQILPQKRAGLAPNSIAVALVEAWRGELCQIAVTGADGRLEALSIVDPSFHNWTGLAVALRGQQISDFPLCNKSFNLSYCGHDL